MTVPLDALAAGEAAALLAALAAAIRAELTALPGAALAFSRP